MIKRAILLMTVATFVAAPMASAVEQSCCCEAQRPSQDCQQPCALQAAAPVATAIMPSALPTLLPRYVEHVALAQPTDVFSPALLQLARECSPSLHAPPLKRYLLTHTFRL